MKKKIIKDFVDILYLKASQGDFPGGPVVKTLRSLGLAWWRSGWESACQCRGHGFEPWSRKIPHAAEQLGPCTITTEPVLWSPRATTTEPVCHNHWSPCALSPCSTTREATAMRGPRSAMKSGPCSPQLEKSLHAATKTQHSQK